MPHRQRRQLDGPGDHVVAEVGRTPVLVVRGADRVLRAFANVCRHRAGPIALCDGRAAKMLACRYHGWTYDLEGRLLRAPEMNEAADFRVADIRLPSFRAGEWQGLVFVALDEGVPPLGEVYRGIAGRIAPIDLAGMEFVRRDSWDIAGNWKVYVDNYLEGYQVAQVHPTLAPLLDDERYATTTARWASLQASPLARSGPYAPGEALYWWLFPNTMLNVLPGRLQTNRVTALAIDLPRLPRLALRTSAHRD